MITQTQNTILCALEAFLKGERYAPPQSTDWQALYTESRAQAVALSCLQGLEANGEQEGYAAWKNYAVRSFRSNANVHGQHAYLHRLMTEAEIPYVILKGSASAYYYPDPFMRAMGDVDFMVADEHFSRAVEALLADGFTQMDMKHDSHLVFYKGKVRLELHFRPTGLPDGAFGSIINAYMGTLYECSTAVELGGEVFQKPADFHHGLILLMHTYHHLLGEGVGLRHLCDWAVFVNAFEGESFSETFEEKLSAVGLWRFAVALSQACCRFLGIPRRAWMGDIDEELCTELVEDIFQGGNFGEKDKERSLQGFYISNRGKGGVKKSKWGQFFRSVNASGKVQFPRMAKIPILKHFCFVPLGVRYVFRLLTGKRKRMKFISNAKEAEKRKQIYQRFHLFEVEDS